MFRRTAIGLGCFFAALFTLLMGFELYRIAVPIGGGVVLIRAQRVRLRPSLCLEAKKRSNQMIAFANTLWYNSSTKKEGGIAMANT